MQKVLSHVKKLSHVKSAESCRKSAELQNNSANQSSQMLAMFFCDINSLLDSVLS